MEQIRGNQEGGNALNTTAMWLSASVARKYWINKIKKNSKHNEHKKMPRTIITGHKRCKIYICFRGIKYATSAVLLSFSVRRFQKGPSQSLYYKDDDDDDS